MTYLELINSSPLLKESDTKSREKTFSNLLKAFDYVSRKVSLPSVCLNIYFDGVVDLCSNIIVAESGKEYLIKEISDIFSSGVTSLFSTSPSSVVKVQKVGYDKPYGEIAKRESIVSAEEPSVINVICYVYPKLFKHNQYIPSLVSQIDDLVVNETLLIPTILKYYSLYYASLCDFTAEANYDDFCIKFIKLLNNTSITVKPSDFSQSGKVVPYEL